MKEDEIIEMAKEAGIAIYGGMIWINDDDATQELEAFAKLVAAKERVACWNILFDYAGRDDLTLENESLLKHLADLIKARGEA